MIRAQAALGQAADPTFSAWNQVYDRTMGTSDFAKSMLSLEVAASRTATAVDASASIVVQQLHSTIVLKGNEKFLKGLSELLHSAVDGSHSAQPRTESEHHAASGGSPSSSAAHATAPGQSMKLRLSLLAVSSQVLTLVCINRPPVFLSQLPTLSTYPFG